MTSLLGIRNVPDETLRALKARAAARGESLNTYLVKLLDREVARPTVAEVLARAARRSEWATVSAAGALEETQAERDQYLQQHASP